MAKKQNILLKKSCEFIICNLDITTDLLPDEMLDYWSVKDENDSQDQFNVFLCAYTLYAARKQGHGDVTLEPEKLDPLFENFQAILALEKINRILPLNSEKKKIFDFDSYDGKLNFHIAPNDIPFVKSVIKESILKHE